jgi:hypothetical protein
MASMETAEDLQAWLDDHSVDTSSWTGKGGTQTVEDLLKEIHEGSCEMSIGEDGKPVRIVSIVSVRIMDPSKPDMELIEATEKYKDGTEKSRDKPLARRIRTVENPFEAAVRGIQAELRVEESQIEIDEDQVPSGYIGDKTTSNAFPKLNCRFEVNGVVANVTGLSEEEFYTTSQSGNTRHCWRWQELPEADKNLKAEQDALNASILGQGDGS